MTLLSSVGKVLLSGGKKVLTKLASKEADVALSLTPIGGISKVEKLGVKILPKAVKAAEFLFVGKSPLGTVKKIATTVGLGGFVAGGGLTLIPKLFTGVKTATEKTLDYAFPPPPMFPEVKPKGYIENQFTPIPKKKVPYQDILETGGVLVGSAGVGALIGAGLEKYFREHPSPEQQPPPVPNLIPDTPPKPFAPGTPITPQTQVVGKEAGRGLAKRRKHRKEVITPRITFRNQNIQIVGRNYA